MINILCYGDSNTWGHNPVDCTRIEKRWTKILADMLGKDYNVIEEGLCGRTTVFDDAFSCGRNGLKLFLPIMSSHQPLDLIIIMLGTNDMQRQFAIPPKDIARGVREIVRVAKNPMNNEMYPTPKILVISPILIEKSIMSGFFDEMFGEESVEISRKLGAAMKNMAEEENVYFLDAAQYAKASELDGIHMNPENHRLLAEAVYSRITEIIK